MISQLAPILFMAFLSLAFGAVVLFAISLIGKRYKASKAKLSAYESGTMGEQTSSTKVPVKFYLTAISFIVFDIEAIFIYPWAIAFKDFIAEGYGLYMLSVMSLFVFALIWGLFYEWKSGGLDWD